MVSGLFFNSSKNLEMKRSTKNKNTNKNKKISQKLSSHHFGKTYVCPTGRLSQILFTAPEPAAHHSGAQGTDRRSLDNDSKTIQMPCTPVLSKPSQMQVFSQVKPARHGDATPTHRQETDVLCTGCPAQGSRGQFTSFIKRSKAESFKNPSPLIFVELYVA